MKFEKQLTQNTYLEIISNSANPKTIYKQLERNGTIETAKSLRIPAGEEIKLLVEIKEGEYRPKGEITFLRRRKKLEEMFERDYTTEFCGFYPIQKGEQKNIYSEINRTLKFVEENIIKNLPKTKIPLKKIKFNPKSYTNLRKNKNTYTADIEIELKVQSERPDTLQNFFENTLSTIHFSLPFGGVKNLSFGIIMAHFSNLELSTANLEKNLKKEIKEKFYNADFESTDFQTKLNQIQLINKLKNSKKNLLNTITKHMKQSTTSSSISTKFKIPELNNSEILLIDFYNAFFANKENSKKIDNLREILLLYEENQEILKLVSEKTLLKNIKLKPYKQ